MKKFLSKVYGKATPSLQLVAQKCEEDYIVEVSVKGKLPGVLLICPPMIERCMFRVDYGFGASGFGGYQEIKRCAVEGLKPLDTIVDESFRTKLLEDGLSRDVPIGLVTLRPFEVTSFRFVIDSDEMKTLLEKETVEDVFEFNTQYVFRWFNNYEFADAHPIGRLDMKEIPR
jgi:hypothetical protein